MVFYRRWFKIGAGVAGGVTSLALFFMLLSSHFGFEIVGTDDYCVGSVENPCLSYVNITNPTKYNVDMYNNEGLELEFKSLVFENNKWSEVSRDYDMFRKDGRCSGKSNSVCCSPRGICLKGWNYINFTDETKPRSDTKYVYRFSAYDTSEFVIAIIKDSPSEVLKYSLFLDLEGLHNGEMDPFLYPITSTTPSGIYDNTTYDSDNSNIRLNNYSSIIYKFDVNYSGEILDLSNSNHNGIYYSPNNPEFINDNCFSGGCMYFNGTTGSADNITIEGTLEDTDNFSVSYRVNFLNYDFSDGINVHLTDDSNSYPIIENRGDDYRVRFNSDSNENLACLDRFSQNTWYNLGVRSFVINSSHVNVTMFIDGVACNSGFADKTMMELNKIVIGSFTDSNAFGLNGTIDDFYFFDNLVLNDSQFLDLYSGNGNSSSFIPKYYKSGSFESLVQGTVKNSLFDDDNNWLNMTLTGVFDNNTEVNRQEYPTLNGLWTFDNTTSDQIKLHNDTFGCQPNFTQAKGINGSAYFKDQICVYPNAVSEAKITNGSNPTHASWCVYYTSTVESNDASSAVIYSDDGSIGFFASNDDYTCSVRNESGGIVQNSLSNDLYKDEPIYHCCVVNGTHLNHYMNFEIRASKAFDGSISDGDGTVNFYVGAQRTIGDRRVTGFIDEVRLENRSLSIPEQKEIFGMMTGAKIEPQLQSSTTNFSGSGYVTPSSFNLLTGNAFFSNIPQGRYSKYKINYDSYDTEFTPKVENVSIGYDDFCLCPDGNTGNWNVNLSNYCIVNSHCDMKDYNLTFLSGTIGNFTVNNSIELNLSGFSNVHENVSIALGDDSIVRIFG